MTRSFLRQDAQVRQSVTYDDTVAPSLANYETNPLNLEEDLNNLRSNDLDIKGTTNWYDPVTRDLETVNTALVSVEEKPLLFGTQVLTDITVTAAQNFEVLSVAGTEAPTVTASVDASTAEGAVVAFHTGAFGAHALDLVAGPNALQPKNLVTVRDTTTSEPIISSNGKVIYGLIQSEVVTDGHTFNDTTQQVQLSFVEENAGGTALIATLAADIATKSINYRYIRRLQLQNLGERAFLNAVFVDQTATTDVTLNNAVDNQSGPVTQVQNIDYQQAASVETCWQDAASADFFCLKEDSAGSDTRVHILADTDVFDSDALVNDMANGLSVDTTGTQIDLGTTAGTIERAADLFIAATGAGELYLDDSNQTGSTWAQTGGIKLADTTAEWDLFETNFGEVSLLNGINQAAAVSGGDTMAYAQAVLQSNVSADTDVSGPSGSSNLDVDLLDYSTLTFTSDVMCYLNGQLLRTGANAAANEDVYPGTTASIGELKFEFALHGSGGNPDVLTMVTYT